MSLLDNINVNNIPNHVAIIMDGNGRWAKQRGFERTEGHVRGVQSVKDVVKAAVEVGVKYLTVYAFSTENWLRPQEEVDVLMDLMVQAVSAETDDLIANGVSLRYIGDIERLPQKTRNAIKQSEKETSGGENLTLVVAMGYSSRWEITEAIKKISRDINKGDLVEDDITEKTIEQYLTTQGFPELDLLIRTGGDVRISNFLLWQVAYSELIFTDVFWPDFGKENFYEAIIDFQKKERRFGKTSEQIEKEKL